MKVIMVPSTCDVCDKENGAIVFKEEKDARVFRESVSLFICKECFEDAQQESVDRHYKWTKLT